MTATTRLPRIARRRALALTAFVVFLGRSGSAASNAGDAARSRRLRNPRIYVREADRALAAGDCDLAQAMIALAYLAFDAGTACWAGPAFDQSMK